MLLEMEENLKNSKLSWHIGPTEDWISKIQNTKFNLAPRGFGRTSFRLCEIIQLGIIPVYIYDDIPWLPCQGTDLDFSTYGISGQMGQLKNLVENLRSMSNTTVQSMLDQILIVREHYTYQGVINQINKFITDPLGPLGGQLRCTTVPKKDH